LTSVRNKNQKTFPKQFQWVSLEAWKNKREQRRHFCQQKNFFKMKTFHSLVRLRNQKQSDFLLLRWEFAVNEMCLGEANEISNQEDTKAYGFHWNLHKFCSVCKIHPRLILVETSDRCQPHEKLRP
jgi:hypothetical protein